MPSDDELLWRGTSPDERADERRSKLIAACRDIVGHDGSSALTVRSVCGVANVSPRKFYECFPDTGALLVATYDSAVEELLVAVTSAARGPKERREDSHAVRTRLRAVYDAATSHLEQHPAAGRIIFREALTNDGLRARALTVLPTFLQTIQRGVVGSGRPTARRFRTLETTLMSGALSAVFTEWLSGTTQNTRKDVVEYCTEATLAILEMTVSTE